jgi:hypothetical protein
MSPRPALEMGRLFSVGRANVPHGTTGNARNTTASPEAPAISQGSGAVGSPVRLTLRGHGARRAGPLTGKRFGGHDAVVTGHLEFQQQAICGLAVGHEELQWFRSARTPVLTPAGGHPAVTLSTIVGRCPARPPPLTT